MWSSAHNLTRSVRATSPAYTSGRNSNNSSTYADLLGWVLDNLPQPRHGQVELVPHRTFFGGFESFVKFLKFRQQFLLLSDPKIVDSFLLLRQRTDDPRGAGPQVELNMIGMRQGLWGIGDAELFAALKFVFLSDFVVHDCFDELAVLRLLLSLDHGQHLGEEPLGARRALGGRDPQERKPARSSRPWRV